MPPTTFSVFSTKSLTMIQKRLLKTLTPKTTTQVGGRPWLWIASTRSCWKGKPSQFRRRKATSIGNPHQGSHGSLRVFPGLTSAVITASPRARHASQVTCRNQRSSPPQDGKVIFLGPLVGCNLRTHCANSCLFFVFRLTSVGEGTNSAGLPFFPSCWAWRGAPT